MNDIFSGTGVAKPGRGKGTRLSRANKRSNTTTRSHARTTSPNDEALQQLNRILEEHDGITPDVRQLYIGLYRGSDNLRHMNRPVLAEVMVLMYQYQIGSVGDQGEVTNIGVFSQPALLQPYIDRIFSRTETTDQKGKSTELQRKIMYIKMADTMLSYARNVLNLISAGQQQAREADLSTMQGPAIDQQLDLAYDSYQDEDDEEPSSSAPGYGYPVSYTAPVQVPYVPTTMSAVAPQSDVVDNSAYSPMVNVMSPRLF